MPLVSMRQLLDHAAENGYGLPAFNVNNMEQVWAIMEAAAQVDAPVIMQASAGARKYAGEPFLRHQILAALEAYPNIPIVMHQETTGAAASSAAGGAGWRQAAAARPTPNSANANHAGKRAGKRTGKRTKRLGILRSAIRARKRPRGAAFFGVFQAVQRTIWFSSPLA